MKLANLGSAKGLRSFAGALIVLALVVGGLVFFKRGDGNEVPVAPVDVKPGNGRAHVDAAGGTSSEALLRSFPELREYKQWKADDLLNFLGAVSKDDRKALQECLEFLANRRPELFVRISKEDLERSGIYYGNGQGLWAANAALLDAAGGAPELWKKNPELADAILEGAKNAETFRPADFLRLTELVESRGKGKRLWGHLSEYLDLLKKHDGEKAAEVQLQSLVKSSPQGIARTAALSKWFEVAPFSASERLKPAMLSRLSPEEMETLARGSAQGFLAKDPESGLRWIAANENGAFRLAALHSLVKSWLATDPNAAGKGVLDNLQGEDRKEAAQMIVDYLVKHRLESDAENWRVIVNEGK